MWFYLVSCYLMFKLGVFHQRRPGEIPRFVKLAWDWLRNNLLLSGKHSGPASGAAAR